VALAPSSAACIQRKYPFRCGSSFSLRLRLTRVVPFGFVASSYALCKTTNGARERERERERGEEESCSTRWCIRLCFFALPISIQKKKKESEEERRNAQSSFHNVQSSSPFTYINCTNGSNKGIRRCKFFKNITFVLSSTRVRVSLVFNFCMFMRNNGSANPLGIRQSFRRLRLHDRTIDGIRRCSPSYHRYLGTASRILHPETERCKAFRSNTVGTPTRKLS